MKLSIKNCVIALLFLLALAVIFIPEFAHQTRSVIERVRWQLPHKPEMPAQDQLITPRGEL